MQNSWNTGSMKKFGRLKKGSGIRKKKEESATKMQERKKENGEGGKTAKWRV